jgi:hypothetical protein
MLSSKNDYREKLLHMVAFETIQNRMKISFVVQLGETHPP